MEGCSKSKNHFALFFFAAYISLFSQGSVFARNGQFDAKCHHFGLENGQQPLIPIAFPGIENISPDGSMFGIRDLNDTIRKMMEIAGLFYPVTPEYYPPSAVFEGTGTASIDFHGWLRGGAAVLLKVSLKDHENGYAEVDLFFYLNEEGALLELPDRSEKVRYDAIPGVINRWFNDLIYCLTGKHGIFGSRITYSVRGNGQAKEIGTVEVGSSKGKTVTSDGSINILPSWSPDGGVIYTSYKSGNPSIYKDGKKFISHGDMVYGGQYSPDGRMVAATVVEDGNADICLFDGVSGEFLKRLTEQNSIDTGPSWSPDGKLIAFVSDRDGSPQIYMISVEGGAVKRISMAGSYNTAPDWSPDGAAISFSGRIAGERSAIFKVKLDTLEMVQLTSGIFTDEEPSYSPDGKLIAFTSNMSGKKQIYVMTSEGKNVKQITDDDNEYFTPNWEKFFANK